MPRILIEACVETEEDARRAEAAGADRIELSAALEVGGVTPSIGLLERVVAAVALPVVALVRPRVGDFVHDAGESAAIRRDVAALRAAGAAGVAVGGLDATGGLDVALLRACAAEAEGIELVCHRAFDVARDREAALATLLELGFDRVLTSGGAATAEAGAASLARLVQRSAGAIVVLVAGGVGPGNAAAICAATGCVELHGSFRGDEGGSRASDAGFGRRRPLDAEALAATRLAIDAR